MNQEEERRKEQVEQLARARQLKAEQLQQVISFFNAPDDAPKPMRTRRNEDAVPAPLRTRASSGTASIAMLGGPSLRGGGSNFKPY